MKINFLNVSLFPALARKLVLGYVRKFCNNCHLVITPTNIVAKRLQELGITAPIQAIPTGVKLEEFANTDPGWLRREYGIGPEEKVLPCVARFAKEKNLDMVLDAFFLINRDCPEARLFLVGLGPPHCIRKGNLQLLYALFMNSHSFQFTKNFKQPGGFWHDFGTYLWFSFTEARGQKNKRGQGRTGIDGG